MLPLSGFLRARTLRGRSEQAREGHAHTAAPSGWRRAAVSSCPLSVLLPRHLHLPRGSRVPVTGEEAEAQRGAARPGCPPAAGPRVWPGLPFDRRGGGGPARGSDLGSGAEPPGGRARGRGRVSCVFCLYTAARPLGWASPFLLKKIYKYIYIYVFSHPYFGF